MARRPEPKIPQRWVVAAAAATIVAQIVAEQTTTEAGIAVWTGTALFLSKVMS